MDASQARQPRGINTTHGHNRVGKKSPTYRAWDNMIQRVRRPANAELGITVCDRWLVFENFLADMGEKPEGMSLGRIELGAGFDVANCRWMTRAEVYGKRLPGRDSYGQKPNATEHPLYSVWQGMVRRTTSPGSAHYPDYGGRGITMCRGWLDSFDAFLEDMGERPAGLSIERVNNDFGYWCGRCDECVRLGRPANCKWATATEQARNRRTTRLYTFNGKTQNAVDWAAETGIALGTLHRRIYGGMPIEEALTRPIQHKYGRSAK
jgi:hypothetical protein